MCAQPISCLESLNMDLSVDACNAALYLGLLQFSLRPIGVNERHIKVLVSHELWTFRA